MPEVVLRRCTAADGPVLLALFKETIQRVNSADYNPEQIAAWASDEIDPAAWNEKRAAQWTLAAEEAGVVLGFVGLEDAEWLDMFFVAAGAQRRGVGRTLMEAALGEGRRRGWKQVASHVSVTARPFFERFGFTVEEDRRFLHRGVEFQNFRMRRSLA